MTIKNKFLRFAGRNAVGKLLLEQLPMLPTPPKVTTVDEIVDEWLPAQRNSELTRKDVIDAAHTMDKQGIVKYVVGRRGGDTRILWQFNTGDLSEDAEDEGDEAEEVKTSHRPDSQIAAMIAPQRAVESDFGAPVPLAVSAPSASQTPGAAIDHFFRVRPDFAITLSLPTDLSVAEAERLAAFIKTLPF